MAPRILAPLALLAACTGPSPAETDSGETGDTDTEPQGPPLLVGAVAKGPFLLGSSVTVSPLTPDGAATGAQFSTQTSDDLGQFSVQLADPGPISIEGTGFYYDEVGASLSTSQLTLRAYAELAQSGQQSAYLNVLTHLSYNRVQTLVRDGLAFAEARTQAEEELYDGLAIGPATFDPGDANTLNLLGGDTDANAYLFAVSAILLQVAHEDAGPTGPVDAKLQQWLNTISSDLASDGQIDASTRDRLHRTAVSLDHDLLEVSLQSWFDQVGSTAVVPDLARVLTDYDVDDDGVPGGCDVLDLCIDCDDDDASVQGPIPLYPDLDEDGFGDADATVELTCPGDGWAADGTDCDDAQPLAHPGQIEVCNGFDDDCDGKGDVDATDKTRWVQDNDGDGYDFGYPSVTCKQPAGYIAESASLGRDCDDTRADTHPNATEVWYDGIDQNCDGRTDFDQDGDGSLFPVDCRDTDKGWLPGAPEKFDDGKDTDCDGGDNSATFRVLGTEPLQYGVQAFADPNGVTLARLDRQMSVVYQLETTSTSQARDGTSGGALPGAVMDAGPTANGAALVQAWSSPSSHYGLVGTFFSRMYNGVDANQLTVHGDTDEATDVARDIELRTDASGYIWTVTCSDDVLFFEVRDPTANDVQIARGCVSNTPDTYAPHCDADGDNDGVLDPPSGPDPTPYVYAASTTCYLDPPTTVTGTVATITRCNGVSCEQLLADRSNNRLYRKPTQTAPATWKSSESNGWRTFLSTAGRLTMTNGSQTWDPLPTRYVYEASVTGDANRVFIGALVEDGNWDGYPQILVAVGDPDAPLAQHTLYAPVGYRTLAITVAPGATSDWVAIAATNNTGPGSGGTGTLQILR